MEIFLVDGHCRANLYPITQLRHTAAIRIGILTIEEKWKGLTPWPIHLVAEMGISDNSKLYIDANLIPTTENFEDILAAAGANTDPIESGQIKRLRYAWEIPQLNDWAIRQDYRLITESRISGNISDSNRIVNQSNIFIEEGAMVDFTMLNASEGPIYIGKNALVMEGSLIKGPFAACEQSVVKMGSKIYGGTTIGPWCVAGGEIKNSILLGYSNKAHDGYLGDSVIGEWCNLGAGTSNSNVKNTAGDVVFNLNGIKVNAGFKAGLVMGDYSRAAINTSFNTGTIVGISCNIFGYKTPPRQIANFTWGDANYLLDKAIRDIENWKRLKNKTLSEADKLKLTELYNK